MQSSSHSISDETLMGYILMALPDEEQSKIESMVVSDSGLESRITDLRSLLFPVQHSMTDAYEPNGSLVSNTMDFIKDQSAAMSLGEASPKGMSAVFESANRQTKLAWIDSLVVVAAGITILCLLLPSVWYSREEARRIACANHLIRMSEASQEFAHSNTKSELPSIDLSGPLSFAGVYVMKLKDVQLIDSPRWVWCPANNFAALDLTVPSVSQFLNAGVPQQQSWRKTIGGSYSYSLGFIVDGRYETPRIQEPFASPIMGDSLRVSSPLSVSSQLSTAHEGRAAVHGVNQANILFTNGSVRVVRLNDSHFADSIDHPYLNRQKVRSAGLGRDDSCLGPSYLAPITSAVFKD